MKNNFFANLKKAYLIAEIGVNHNGNIDLAKEMILLAKECGADAVKFQTYKTALLASPETPKVDYQKKTTDLNESHYDMLKKLELSRNDHIELFQFCKKNHINFLSTPYDINSAKFLKDLGVNFFKTASADIVDLPLHEFIASTGNPTIISTGMSTMSEIKKVIDIYKKKKNNNFILLHCVSNYPCSDQSLNMNAISTIKNKFLCPVGYSDHSIGNLAAVIAISKGAKLIEKHFTKDKSLNGPDHKASSDPDEFKELVKNVRRSEKMLGSFIKNIQEEEIQMSSVSKKSIFLSRNLKKNAIIKISDVFIKRPGNGILANEIYNVCGMKIKINLKKNHKLLWSDLNK
jgi:N-acetylneuraminate synthase/N,N'-diacetyllegionaminate synthase